MLSAEIKMWLAGLTSATLGIREVWLLGSRANDTAKEKSDWDFLLFLEADALNEITAMHRFHRTDVDLFVVMDGDSFQRVWGPAKSGSLSSWEWEKQTPRTATYRSLKWIPDEENADAPPEIVRTLGNFDSFTSKAIRAWP